MSFFQTFFEVEIVGGSFGYADVATGVDAPALGFDFREGGYFAKSWYYRRRGRWGMSPVCCGAAIVSFDGFAAVEAYDVGEKFDLVGGEFAVGAVELFVDVTGVDEEDFIARGTLRLPLSKNQSVQGKVTV